MLTYRNLIDQVLKFLDQAGDTGTGLDLVKYALQTSHEKRAMAERWSFMLWPTPITFSFVEGKRNYILHPLAAMLTDFWNDTADMIMREVPTRSRFKKGVQDDRYHFEFVRNVPVKVQPATGVLTVTGSVRIVFVNAAGDVVSEDVTNASTVASVVEVVDVTKLTDVATTIVDSASTNILTLAVGEFNKTYPQIRLFGDGVGSEKARYRFYRRPTLLTHDNDIPNIPFPFSRILVFDALLELATYNDSLPQRYWLAQQAEWERLLQQTYQEGEMEGSESRTVHDIDVYEG